MEELLLWDPVVEGTAFLRELDSVAHPPLETGPATTVGVLGFPLTQKMRSEIEQIDLRRGPATGWPRTSILVSSEQPDARELETALCAAGTEVRYQVVESAGSWNEVDNFGGALVPQEILQGIVATLSSGPAAGATGSTGRDR